jgi:outer membrane protein OmpA-like peptidoglycan-associated protein
MRTLPTLLKRLRPLLPGALLVVFAACSTAPSTPVEPRPEVALERPTAAPAPAPAAASSPAPAATPYLWSDSLAALARRLRVELPGDFASVTQSADQRLWLSVAADAMFAPGRSALLPAATPWLDRVAALLRESPNVDVQILGEPDASVRDTRAAHLLALDRAASARDWLVARGVAARRIAVAGRQLPSLRPLETRRLDILIGERASKPR